MNQILFQKHDTKKEKFILKFQFIAFLLLIIVFVCFLIMKQYKSYEKENSSKILAENYNIILLYSKDNNSYTTVTLNNDLNFIGIIEIPKLDLKYPISPNISESLLESSPCKFYGPNPNEIGNFCIAGHNLRR